MVPTESDYWLRRYETAVVNAADAPGERSRTAYLELAQHYWSMHAFVLRRVNSTPLHTGVLQGDEPLIRWAA